MPALAGASGGGRCSKGVGVLRIDCVVGGSGDPGMSDALHDVAHHGVLDYVVVEPTDLDRRRLKVLTEAGEEVAITLPRDQKLFDGAVLLLTAERAIVVRAGAQRWLRLSPRSAPDALELGYHAGNLHWRVKFDGGDLLVAQDGPAAAYAARIEPLLSSGRVTLSEGAS